MSHGMRVLFHSWQRAVLVFPCRGPPPGQHGDLLRRGRRPGGLRLTGQTEYGEVRDFYRRFKRYGSHALP